MVAKVLGIAVGAYIGVVAAFESRIGYLQPTNEHSLVITTTDENRVGIPFRILTGLPPRDFLRLDPR